MTGLSSWPWKKVLAKVVKEKKAVTSRLLGWREGEEEERSVKKKWICTRKEGGSRWSSQTPWCVRAGETAMRLRVLAALAEHWNSVSRAGKGSSQLCTTPAQGL